MALESTQPLTEMSTRNLPEGKGGRRVRLSTSPPSVSRFSRKCGSLDVSQPYGPPRSVTGIALPLPCCEALSVYVLAVISDTKFHAYTKQRINWNFRDLQFLLSF
jgi:hypothetical protein